MFEWSGKSVEREAALARMETAMRVPVGSVSPLWAMFAGAASVGVAYWWMARWTRPVNVEAVLAEPALLPAADTPLEAPVEPVAEAAEIAEAEIAEARVVETAVPEPAALEAVAAPAAEAQEAVVEAALDPVPQPAPEFTPEPPEAPVMDAAAEPPPVAEAEAAPTPRKRAPAKPKAAAPKSDAAGE